MRRREFASILAGAAASSVLWSLPEPVGAQTASSAVRKLGVVTLGVPQSSPLIKEFITGLRELGYEPGKNLVLEFRNAEGRADRLPSLVTEVIAKNIDIIVVESIAAAIVAKKASQTLPIVVAIASDPVGAGVFASLLRPVATPLAFPCSRKRSFPSGFNSFEKLCLQPQRLPFFIIRTGRRLRLT